MRKTTLARHFVSGRYFDLEKPSDLQVFAGDIEYALRQLKGPLIVDEAQTLPSLFPILRALIDEARRTHGRFFLPGSVSPAWYEGGSRKPLPAEWVSSS